MGYDRHHAIVVTGSMHHMERARAEALRIFGRPDGHHLKWDLVSPIVKSPANDVQTFLVAPDGGKQGQRTSDEGDSRRAEFVAYLEAQQHEDGQSPLSWVEIQYGDDYLETKVVNDSDATMRALDTTLP